MKRWDSAKIANLAASFTVLVNSNPQATLAAVCDRLGAQFDAPGDEIQERLERLKMVKKPALQGITARDTALIEKFIAAVKDVPDPFRQWMVAKEAAKRLDEVRAEAYKVAYPGAHSPKKPPPETEAKK